MITTLSDKKFLKKIGIDWIQTNRLPDIAGNNEINNLLAEYKDMGI